MIKNENLSLKNRDGEKERKKRERKKSRKVRKREK